MSFASEYNFDGLVGPTHNYAGLSLGNVASAANAGEVSRPREAALQGLAKMRAMIALGLPQGLMLPHPRPNRDALRRLGYQGPPAAIFAAAFADDPRLFANLCSASAMWTANAATVSPSADTGDGRVHLTPANLAAMLHRSFESGFTVRQLRTMFPDARHFAVHEAVPGGAHLGDEGAANHLRLAPGHGEAGLEIFVHGTGTGGRFPVRQRERASRAVARLHGLDPKRTLFVQQSARAVEAGAFHADVLSVANERVLLAHEAAFEDRVGALSAIRAALPDVVVIEAPEAEVAVDEAIRSYLFNSQLVSLPNAPGRMALALPTEAEESRPVRGWLERLIAVGGPIAHLRFFDLRQSMRNGGGPACLRLRVVLTEAEAAAVDPRFLLDEARIDRLCGVVAATYPETIERDALGDPGLHRQAAVALDAVARELDLAGMYPDEG